MSSLAKRKSSTLSLGSAPGRPRLRGSGAAHVAEGTQLLQKLRRHRGGACRLAFAARRSSSRTRPRAARIASARDGLGGERGSCRLAGIVGQVVELRPRGLDVLPSAFAQRRAGRSSRSAAGARATRRRSPAPAPPLRRGGRSARLAPASGAPFGAATPSSSRTVGNTSTSRTVEASRRPGLDAGTADEEGDAQRRLVGEEAVQRLAVLAQALRRGRKSRRGASRRADRGGRERRRDGPPARRVQATSPS